MSREGEVAIDAKEQHANIHYPGTELTVFAEVRIWRAYWHAQIAPFVHGRVLEVGAGIGTNTQLLSAAEVENWIALEPDPEMVDHLLALLREGRLPDWCEPLLGTIRDIPVGSRFDTLLYADVLEHIEQDRAELLEAAARLDRGGNLIVLAPAHQQLFSPFDAAIGHFRRYALRQLVALGPPDLQLVCARYLDSVGMIASVANRLLLRSGTPTPAQVRVWDRLMGRISRWLDPVFLFKVGKSVLVIWRKP
jgi:SAM-dependent methyltransferase